MKVIATELPGVLLVEPTVFADARGFFLETYQQERYTAAGIPGPFVQANHSRSAPGTLRGLHYQLQHPQGKLVRCVRGALYDVAVDIRRGSPTFGKWVSAELTEENRRQFYVPPGFAHGFCVPKVVSEMEYLCTDYYYPEDERGLIWDDPSLGITWPVSSPTLSQRDRSHPRLTAENPHLPAYRTT